MAKTYGLFQSHIWHGSLNNKKLIQEALKDSYKMRESDKLGLRWSQENYPKGYTSYSSWDQIHYMNSTFKNVADKIQVLAQAFAKKLGFNVGPKHPLELTQFWINIQNQGGFHSGHIHPLSTLSGTIYLKTPKDCGAIRFEDPRLTCFMGGRSRISSKNTNPYFELVPKAGDIVLFESWMRHEVLFNKSKDDRVSLSFNFF